MEQQTEIKLIAEWGERKYQATVNRNYDVAIIEAGTEPDETDLHRFADDGCAI